MSQYARPASPSGRRLVGPGRAVYPGGTVKNSSSTSHGPGVIRESNSAADRPRGSIGRTRSPSLPYRDYPTEIVRVKPKDRGGSFSANETNSTRTSLPPLHASKRLVGASSRQHESSSTSSKPVSSGGAQLEASYILPPSSSFSSSTRAQEQHSPYTSDREFQQQHSQHWQDQKHHRRHSAVPGHDPLPNLQHQSSSASRGSVSSGSSSARAQIIDRGSGYVYTKQGVDDRGLLLTGSRNRDSRQSHARPMSMIHIDSNGREIQRSLSNTKLELNVGSKENRDALVIRKSPASTKSDDLVHERRRDHLSREPRTYLDRREQDSGKRDGRENALDRYTDALSRRRPSPGHKPGASSASQVRRNDDREVYDRVQGRGQRTARRYSSDESHDIQERKRNSRADEQGSRKPDYGLDSDDSTRAPRRRQRHSSTSKTTFDNDSSDRTRWDATHGDRVVKASTTPKQPHDDGHWSHEQDGQRNRRDNTDWEAGHVREHRGQSDRDRKTAYEVGGAAALGSAALATSIAAQTRSEPRDKIDDRREDLEKRPLHSKRGKLNSSSISKPDRQRGANASDQSESDDGVKRSERRSKGPQNQNRKSDDIYASNRPGQVQRIRSKSFDRRRAHPEEHRDDGFDVVAPSSRRPVQSRSRSRSLSSSPSATGQRHKDSAPGSSRRASLPGPQRKKSYKNFDDEDSDDEEHIPRRRRRHHYYRRTRSDSHSSRSSFSGTDTSDSDNSTTVSVERRPPPRIVSPSTEATSVIAEAQSSPKEHHVRHGDNGHVQNTTTSSHTLSSSNSTPVLAQGTIAAPPKGILKRPKEKFPEELDEVREGVAPLDAAKKGIPPEARWTRVNRRLVNPEALDREGIRFEEYSDHVIVLKVLSPDEIGRLTRITHEIREQRRRVSGSDTQSGPSSGDTVVSG